jgi:hypothetical protein
LTNKPKLTRALWLIVVLAALVAAEDAGSASVYSLVLVGESVESGDVRAIALGGSTQLFVDSLGAVQSNAALLSRVRQVTISATQYVAVDEGRSEDLTRRDVSFTFSSLRVVFPIVSLFRLSIGYVGRYEPDGTFALRGVTEGGDGYAKTYAKSGGLFAVPLTAAFDLTRFASAGLTFSLERGTVEERWDVVFDEREFAPAAGLSKHDLSGTGYGAAAAVYPFEGLVIGGSYESRIEYDAQVSERYTQSTLDNSYTETVTLPARFSAGVTWTWADRLMVLASARWADFTEFEGLGFPQDRLRREETYSLGFEYLKGIGLRGRRMPLRVGFNYGRLPFYFPQGDLGSQGDAAVSEVTKYLVSLGTGIRIRGGKGTLDFAVVVGKDGSLGTNGIEDRLVRIYIGLAGSEAWKRRGGERY